MTHSIGEIEWDETDPTHIVGRLTVTHNLERHELLARYELHIYTDETMWCEMYWAFADVEFRATPTCCFREETVGVAKAALARQVELGWR